MLVREHQKYEAMDRTDADAKVVGRPQRISRDRFAHVRDLGCAKAATELPKQLHTSAQCKITVKPP